MTMNEVCNYLKLSRSTVSKIIAEGKLKVKNIGGEKKRDYRIKKEWVNEYLEKGKSQ